MVVVLPESLAKVYVVISVFDIEGLTSTVIVAVSISVSGKLNICLGLFKLLWVKL